MELLWCCSINKLNILLSLGWYGRHPSLLGDHCGHAILHQHRFGHRPLCWLFSSYRTCFHRLQRYVFNTKLGNFTTTYLTSAWVLNVVFGRQIYSSVIEYLSIRFEGPESCQNGPKPDFFQIKLGWCDVVKWKYTDLLDPLPPTSSWIESVVFLVLSKFLSSIV